MHTHVCILKKEKFFNQSRHFIPCPLMFIPLIFWFYLPRLRTRGSIQSNVIPYDKLSSLIRYYIMLSLLFFFFPFWGCHPRVSWQRCKVVSIQSRISIRNILSFHGDIDASFITAGVLKRAHYFCTSYCTVETFLNFFNVVPTWTLLSWVTEILHRKFYPALMTDVVVSLLKVVKYWIFYS